MKTMNGSVLRNGVRTIYQRSDPTSHAKATLIFLHGLGGDHTVWGELRDHFLSSGYSVLTVDLRGHGGSDRPTDSSEYALNELAADVYEIIQVENLKKIILIGHCLGGMVSLNFAVTFPQFLKALILIDTSYKPPNYLQYFIDRPYLYGLLHGMIKYSPTAYCSTPVNFQTFKGGQDINIKRIISDLRHLSLRTYLSICDNLSQFKLSKMLSQISCPTLIIHGLKDTIIPARIAKTLHKKIHHSYLTYIPDGNHILVINNPEELDLDIDLFLTKIVH